jgi:hypothetical protein
MVIDMQPEARKLVIDYFNVLVDAPHRGPFEARIAEQAIKFALIFHVFAHIKIERRSEGTYGVEDLDDEPPPLDRSAMEAGIGISNGSRVVRKNFFQRSARRTKRMSTIGSTSGSRSFLILRLGNSTPPISGFRRWRRRENTSATGWIAGFWSKSKPSRAAAPAGGNFLSIGSLRLSGDGSHEQEKGHRVQNAVPTVASTHGAHAPGQICRIELRKAALQGGIANG